MESRSGAHFSTRWHSIDDMALMSLTNASDRCSSVSKVTVLLRMSCNWSRRFVVMSLLS